MSKVNKIEKYKSKSEHYFECLTEMQKDMKNLLFSYKNIELKNKNVYRKKDVLLRKLINIMF